MIARRSVRFYLAISHALFVFLVLGGTSLVWYTGQEQVAEGAIRKHLEQRARLMATTSDIDQTLNFSPNIPVFYTALASNLEVYYLTTDLRLRSLTDQALEEEDQQIAMQLGKSALQGSTVSKEVYSQDFSHETLYAAAPVFDRSGKVIGAVCLSLSLKEFEATIKRTRSSLVGFTAGMAALSLILGVMLATLLTRPLSKAQHLAARVAGGDYDVRLPEKGPQELAELASYLNRMADELQLQTRQRKIVLANLTHELARPLGGLHLGVESLREGAIQDPALADDMLKDMDQTIQRMEALIDDLSLAARPLSVPLKLNLHPVAVEPLLQGLKSRFWPRAESLGVRLEVSLPTDVPEVMADELRLFQIVSNLIDNAVKFSPQGGKVILSAEIVGSSLRLTVEDHGPGIPERDLERVFEPFFQGESPAKIRQGMGLGLSIAHRLALAHHGSLGLRNLPGGGLLASLILPLAGS
jgi:signal transduction histidine kinase